MKLRRLKPSLVKQNRRWRTPYIYVITNCKHVTFTELLLALKDEGTTLKIEDDEHIYLNKNVTIEELRESLKKQYNGKN
jgi:hypothetical protein